MKLVQAGTMAPTGVSTGGVSQRKAATPLRYYLQWYNSTPTWLLYRQQERLYDTNQDGPSRAKNPCFSRPNR
jgi:hypothetical protein